VFKIEQDPWRNPPQVTRRYNFKDMSVGDKMTIPVENEMPVDVRGRVQSALLMWKRRSGNTWWRFRLSHDKEHVYVHRIDDTVSGGLN
jgi:hypothetical protein